MYSFLKKFNIGPFVRQYVIVILVNLSVICVGISFTWTSPILVKLSDASNSVLDRPITEVEGSWIASITFLSGFFTVFLVTYLVDHIGRKYCLLLSALPRILGYLILIFSTKSWMVMLGRFVTGLSDSFSFIVVPMYASEIASKEIRGALGTMLQIFSALGTLLMLAVGPFLGYVTLNSMILCIVVITAIPLILLPESPYYLHRKGKNYETTKVLLFLRGSEASANEYIKEYEISKNEDKPTLIEALKSKTVLKSFGLVVILTIGTQLTGYNAVQSYLQTILVSTETTVSSEIASVVIGVIQLLASCCTALVIDKFGRKPILTISLLGMALGLFGMGIFFQLSDSGRDIRGFLNYLPLIALIFVVFCYSAGLGSLLWPLMAELFDGRSRAMGMSFGQIFGIILLFLNLRFFPSVTSAIGAAATYWVFCGNCIIMWILIMFFIPETKGKSFSEIQTVLSSTNKTEQKSNP